MVRFLGSYGGKGAVKISFPRCYVTISRDNPLICSFINHRLSAEIHYGGDILTRLSNFLKNSTNLIYFS